MLFTFLKMGASFAFPHSSPQPFKNYKKQPSSDLRQLSQQEDEVLGLLWFNPSRQLSTTQLLTHTSLVEWGKESEA